MAYGLNLQQGVAPVDIGGAIDKGNLEHVNVLKTDEADQGARDNAALRDLFALPDVDMSSSEGIKKAMGHAKGVVSPKALEHLNTIYGTVLDQENQAVDHMTKLHKNELDRASDTNEAVFTELNGIDKESDPQKLMEKRAKAIAGLTERKFKDGTPMFQPDQLQQLSTMPVDQFKAMYGHSKAADALLKRAKDQAEINRTEALAKEATWRTEHPELGKEYSSSSNPNVRYYRSKRGDYAVDMTTGESTSVAGLPQDAEEVGTTAAAKLHKAEELLDFKKNPPTDYEKYMAQQYMVSRKMESLGQNSPLRPRIAMLAAQMAVEQGRSSLADNTVYKAEAANAAKLTGMYGVIKGSENTVLGNLELMKPLAAKVDSTGIPVLERWLRAGKKSIEGDEDVTKWNSLVVSTQADIGKVLSAATGAAGVPVAAMEEAKKYMDGNLTLSQFNALYDIVPKEMKVRTDSIEAQIAGAVSKINRLTGVPQSGAAPAAGVTAVETGTSTPAIATDEERRKELQLARQAAAAEPDPKKKAMAVAAADALEKQLSGKSEKPKPTPADLEYLKAHPEKRAQFEKHFGVQP